MHVIRHPHDLPPIARGGAIAIGNFDGVHRGHAQILEQLRLRAAELEGPAVVFTFDPHPARLLRPEACPAPLTWTERKAELLADLGVDWVLAYPTDMGLLSLSAQEFFDRVVVEVLGARAIVEGPNFYFGKNREGTIDRLAELAEQANIQLDVVPPVEIDGQIVSSSRIRDLVRSGKIAEAHSLLTAPYRIRGLVTHGAGRGTGLGYPTANLEGIDTLLPPHGVYAGVARLGLRHWPAALSLGANPTFGETNVKVEVHLIGCDEALYGQILEVDLLDRLRDIEAFASTELLAQQVERDVASARRTATEYLADRATGRPTSN